MVKFIIMNSIKLEKYTDNIKTIYEDMCAQFPADELKDYTAFNRLLKNRDYELYIARDNETTVGYIIFLKIEDSIWLDYIAVLGQFHGQGYGSGIFSSMKETLKEVKGCWLEVEKPDESEINTIRRIKFYTNLGAKKININYLYPNKTGFLPMDLYYMPLNSDYIPSIEDAKKSIKAAFKRLHSELAHTNKIYEMIINK